MSFQWLVASPVVILDKVKQWENKLRRSGYRIFPCPETPFSVEWDAFRDWKDFTMNWEDPGWQTDLSQKTVLVDVTASLLYDLGYFSDSFWLSSQYKFTNSNRHTFQFIHKTGYYMVQLKYEKEVPVLIRWTRNPLVGVGRRGKETFEEECAADQKAVNELKQMLEFPSEENSAFYKQYKLLTA